LSLAKPFDIPKRIVWEAYKEIRSNNGAAGIDDQSLTDFDKNRKDNLYCLWNRLSSGSYFPPPVKAVPIPKKSGGTRILGVPTVSDRIAQMVVKIVLEPILEPHFHPDSYGYRPGKSAHQALEVTRQRCWRNDWVLEFDIKGLFDNIDHELLMKAVKKHTTDKWVLLYVERWLKAPMNVDGQIIERTKGTPQGGVISPLLANLFMHYAFDCWMGRRFPSILFCRYADDGLLHCRTLAQAKMLQHALEIRFQACHLEMHPDKTRIVYCKDVHRRGKFECIKFDFLGYTFRPRKAVDKIGRCFANFLPAASDAARKAMVQQIRSWHVQLKSDKSLRDIANMFGPILRGWSNYYGRFHQYAMRPVWKRFNLALTQWIMHKYKKFLRRKRRAWQRLAVLSNQNKKLFIHWQKGYHPKVAE
jgi:RNA-directed DNA polymerase